MDPAVVFLLAALGVGGVTLAVAAALSSRRPPGDRREQGRGGRADRSTRGR